MISAFHFLADLESSVHVFSHSTISNHNYGTVLLECPKIIFTNNKDDNFFNKPKRRIRSFRFRSEEKNPMIFNLSDGYRYYLALSYTSGYFRPLSVVKEFTFQNESLRFIREQDI